MTENPACPVCGRAASVAHPARIRNELTDLYGCGHCGLRFFPEPEWLDQLYQDEAVSDLDIGLPLRCINTARIVESVARAERVAAEPALDWGGGFGLLTRLLRDRGVNMFHHDPFAENIFAQGFERPLEGRFGLVTAVEVFEHLTDPVGVLTGIAQHTDLVVISTVVVPPNVVDLRDWWYLGPSGQHITFYTPAALVELAGRCGFQMTSNGNNIHVFHRRKLSSASRLVLRDVRTSVFLARALRMAQRSGSLRDADAADVMKRFSPWAGTR